METRQDQISLHECRFYLQLSQEWKTSKELAESAKISARTARMFALRYAKLGIIDQAEVFPGHRFKRSKNVSKDGRNYVLKLNNAVQVFGLNSK